MTPTTGGRISELDEKPPRDLLQSYTGTKSINQAQKFSFVKTDRYYTTLIVSFKEGMNLAIMQSYVIASCYL